MSAIDVIETVRKMRAREAGYKELAYLRTLR